MKISNKSPILPFVAAFIVALTAPQQLLADSNTARLKAIENFDFFVENLMGVTAYDRHTPYMCSDAIDPGAWECYTKLLNSKSFRNTREDKPADATVDFVYIAASGEVDYAAFSLDKRDEPNEAAFVQMAMISIVVACPEDVDVWQNSFSELLEEFRKLSYPDRISKGVKMKDACLDYDFHLSGMGGEEDPYIFRVFKR